MTYPTSNALKLPYLMTINYFTPQEFQTSVAIERLQKHIDTAELLLKEWKISINTFKTIAILFTNKTPSYTDKVKIKSRTINCASKHKCLGVTIDKNLCFKDHIINTISRSTSAKHILFPVNSKALSYEE